MFIDKVWGHWLYNRIASGIFSTQSFLSNMLYQFNKILTIGENKPISKSHVIGMLKQGKLWIGTKRFFVFIPAYRAKETRHKQNENIRYRDHDSTCT